MNKPNMNDYMDNEPPEEIWFPKVGDKARIVGDWSMGFLQVGEVIAVTPAIDQFGEIDGATFTVRLEDGSQDEYGLEDLLHPDEAYEPEYEDDFDDEEEDADEFADYNPDGDDGTSDGN